MSWMTDWRHTTGEWSSGRVVKGDRVEAAIDDYQNTPLAHKDLHVICVRHLDIFETGG